MGFPGGSVVKNPPANAGDTREAGMIPGPRRFPGVGNGNPLQHSCPENPMNREAWQATIQKVGHDQQLSTTYIYAEYLITQNC